MILEAAAQVLHEQGHAAFTTNEVARRAGVSIGSLYQYFAHKDALLAALVTQVIDRTEHAMLATLSRLSRPGVTAEIWARELMRTWCETHGNPCDHVLYERSRSLPGVRERAESATCALSHGVTKSLRRRDVPNADMQAKVIVQTGFALVHELVIALPHGAQREAAKREATRIIAAYVGA